MVAAVAAAEGLVAYFKHDDRRRADPGILPEQSGWHGIKAVPAIRVWTDDYSNVQGALLHKRFEW